MYLQLTQAAAKLNITRQWVHTLIKQGRLTTTEIAGRRVVIEDDLFRALRRERKAKA